MLDNRKTVIIGGGPAGLMAACILAGSGQKVLLLDKNDMPGRKLGITGKGRCNVTNNCPTDELLRNIPVNPKFLMSSFSRFSAIDAMSFFETHGVLLKTERGNRVFPLSDKASDIVSCLIRVAKSAGTEFIKTTATDIVLKDGTVCAVSTSKGQVECSSCILATGGLSYPKTGSTGDGYRMAASLGHTIIQPKASLVPLEASPEICQALQGLSLKNVSLTVLENGNEIYSDFGEMLFTHFGVSGPLILSASSHMRHFQNKSYKLLIDLKPALNHDTLDKRILRDFSDNPNRDFVNGLDQLLPQKLIPVIVNLSKIPPHRKINSITREERERLVHEIKAMELFVSGPRPIEEAIITSGGVSVKEINPKTMESKKIGGVYFAGEIIDVDAYTGGFNLQIAWSTGFVAGCSIKERCD
ncbi:MAG: NAD(P)/FAD-dependent oxidoreductase [Clostridiales bacterium]|nr:NAD(P)/FAD-dependent oxidoreductase [Clostridiales bacterium]